MVLKNYKDILNKLESFTKKYYTKMLLKGVLLFFSFGVFYFLLTLSIEYFLWLNSFGRGLLLFLFVAVETFLLYKYIFVPLFYLFKLKQGISNKEASLLVGKHFSDVDDKLFNLLDLAEDKEQSELLLASIEQRSKKLSPIEFGNAVDFSENKKYTKYLLIPILIFALIWLSGNFSSFFSSYDRVVNYDLAYEPPAPFAFRLMDSKLDVLENEPLSISLITEGEVKPEEVYIVVDGNEFLLQKDNGVYHYTFFPPLRSADFYFTANDISSRIYSLNALKAPSILDFEVALDFPSYINKASVVLNGTGNATFPEGTKVTWNAKTEHTKKMQLVSKDTIVDFQNQEDNFKLTKRIYNDFVYELSTSNENSTDHEKLAYQFNVVKDAYPTIEVNKQIDSLQPNTIYFSGKSSDDYALVNIKLVCSPENAADSQQVISIFDGNSNFEQFYYTFPSGLKLNSEINYSYYFQVTDNDAIHGGKSSKSAVFSFSPMNDNELINNNLEQQKSLIKNLDNSFDSFKEQSKTLKELNQEQKEQQELSFQDKTKFKDFLEKQQHQEQMMQQFKSQFKESLDKNKKDNELNELLKERLERQEIEAKKNEKLLDELNKIADKIEKEELSKKLEELAKNQSKSQRSLEQILELTKRYYVTEKASQLANELDELAKEQELLSQNEKEKDALSQQEELNNDFNEISDELDELKKDNDALKKPLKLGIEESKQESVKEDQREALEELNKKKENNQSSEGQKEEEKNNKVSQKQQSASKKMQEMSEQLSSSSSGGSSSSEDAEDAEMLRQILDNLIVFSFKQENLFNALMENDDSESDFGNKVKVQQELKDMFEHVDDSLFALSLRRVELSEIVNEQITEVYYNIDKALENIAENKLYQGTANQQYVLTASNVLADFLANSLDNMQQSMMPGSGEGQGQQGFQLPDIIKAQGELSEKMKGQSGKPGGKEGKQPGSEGESGEGNRGEKGKDGEGGQSGEDGKSGKDGLGNSGQAQGSGSNGQSGSGGEGDLQEMYEIYKQQQILRNQLEEQLNNIINSGDRNLAQKLIQQMQDFENDLLNNGITQRTTTKINRIHQQLLKLENASLKQGKENKRKSNTNSNEFNNPVLTKQHAQDNNISEDEILNRQALPLRHNFKNKVKLYFSGHD